jgi:uracil-DNA glycosylase
MPLPVFDGERLDAHRRALAACRLCVGAPSIIAPIIPEANAPLAMLVGQAPGRVEVDLHRGFAGRAGKTLFRWLAEAGFDERVWRERVWMSAMTRCFPGPSPSGRGDRVPSPAEIATCSIWLDAELALVRPRVLVVVGRLAIDRFVGGAPLAEVIGRAHAVRHAGGESLAIPLPHPSGASSWVHQSGHRALLDRALALLARELPELVAESARAAGARVA